MKFKTKESLLINILFFKKEAKCLKLFKLFSVEAFRQNVFVRTII